MNNPPYIFGQSMVDSLIKSAAKKYQWELVAALRQFVRERKILYKVVHANHPKSPQRVAAYNAFEKYATEFLENFNLQYCQAHWCRDTIDGKCKWYLIAAINNGPRFHLSFQDLYAKGRNPVASTNKTLAYYETRRVKLSELSREIVKEEIKKHLVRIERHPCCGECLNFDKTVIPGTKYHQCLAAAAPEEFRRLYLDEATSVTIEDSKFAANCPKFKQK